MSDVIKDGTGKSFEAKVNSYNRLYVWAIQQNRAESATERGDSYTIASTLVSLTSAGESGVFYFKNNDAKAFHMTTAVVSLAPSTGGDATDACLVKVYRNPTTGTLISDANAGSIIKCNRNFASNNVLVGDAYLGAEGKTITDGAVHSQVLMVDGTVRDMAIDEEISVGKSIGFSIEPQDSNTSMKVMVEVLGYLVDPDE